MFYYEFVMGIGPSVGEVGAMKKGRNEEGSIGTLNYPFTRIYPHFGTRYQLHPYPPTLSVMFALKRKDRK